MQNKKHNWHQNFQKQPSLIKSPQKELSVAQWRAKDGTIRPVMSCVCISLNTYSSPGREDHWRKYLVYIMNKLIHLPEPSICVLILEICSHSPHYMICASYIGLKRQSPAAKVKLHFWKSDKEISKCK